MYKLLMASFMSYSLLSATDNFSTLSNNELITEPNICEKVYNDCVDECEKRTPNTFSNCLTDCSTLYEECKEETNENDNSIVSKCRDSYMICTLKCEEKIPQIEQSECYSNCEIRFDKCIDK